MFQRKAWKVQRVGWMLMLLIAIAALSGAFGRGPLSSAHVGAEGSVFRAEYERFLRLQAPAPLTLYVGSEAIGPDSTATVWLSEAWLAGMEVTSITPEPDKTTSGAGRVEYTFRITPSSRPARISFGLVNLRQGRIHGELGVERGPSYSISQFAYP